MFRIDLYGVLKSPLANYAADGGVVNGCDESKTGAHYCKCILEHYLKHRAPSCTILSTNRTEDGEEEAILS